MSNHIIKIRKMTSHDIRDRRTGAERQSKS
jgi:hypothetical protein